jgi:hypothetical protein
MISDRFERDLRNVLRDIAGGEVPQGLRYEVLGQLDEVPDRRLAFVPALRYSVVAAAAMALVALAIILAPRGEVGPAPGHSPEASSSPLPSATTEASRTGESSPTQSAETRPTPAETPASSSDPAAWSGLSWSGPVPLPDGVRIRDLVAWDDGYVAVGEVTLYGAGAEAGFLVSSDGLHWTLEERVDAGAGRFPAEVVQRDGELFAFGPPSTDRPLVWRSADGSSWSQLDSPSWALAWAAARIGPGAADWAPTQHPIVTGLIDVASDPSGLVAIGNSFGDDGMAPVILHSPDGRTWSQAALPAGSGSAILNGVTPYRGGFIIVGAEGIGPDAGTAVAAAWLSADGLAWTRAALEGGPSGEAGSELGTLIAGRDALVSCGGSRVMTAGGPRFFVPWTSTDGRGWRAAENPNVIPACALTAGDGERMVALGPYPYPVPDVPTGTSQAWVSTDGAVWEVLDLSAPIEDPVQRFWVVAHGVVYLGADSVWFGAATVGS